MVLMWRENSPFSPDTFPLYATNCLWATSLVPAALGGLELGDEFIEKLSKYDQEFDRLRSDALRENQVPRFVGVIDVASGVTEAVLERWVLSQS